MAISIITKEDLQQFKTELLEVIKELLHGNSPEQKLWLRSSDVRKLLNMSSGTLQNLRINGTLVYSKLGETLYCSYKDIEKLMTDLKH